MTEIQLKNNEREGGPKEAAGGQEENVTLKKMTVKTDNNTWATHIMKNDSNHIQMTFFSIDAK